MWGNDGHGRIRLAEGENGGGELLVAKPGGTVMVRAGVPQFGVGRVEAFPPGNPLGWLLIGRIRQ